MNIGFRLCFTQSSVVCPSIFISSMPSVKVRFERSKQHEERGSIYYRICYRPQPQVRVFGTYFVAD